MPKPPEGNNSPNRRSFERDTGDNLAGQPSQLRKPLSLEKMTSAAPTNPRTSTDSTRAFLEEQQKKSETIGGVYGFSHTGSKEKLSTDVFSTKLSEIQQEH